MSLAPLFPLLAAAALAQAPDGGTPQDAETTVRAARVRREVAAPAVPGEEARELPLALGDAAAVVQSLPGVARAPLGSGGLVVFGATPAESRIVIDDVPVPWLFHRGGLRSALSDALLGSIELVPAGFGPQHGRATGALVKVATAAPPADGFGASLAADFIDGEGALRYQQPEDEGPHAVLLSGRLGFLSHLLPLLDPNLEKTIAVPQTWDYGGKWLVRSRGATTQVLLLGAGDSVQRPYSMGGGETQERWFHRAAVRHQAPLATGGRVEAGLWVGADKERTEHDFVSSRALQDTLALRAGGRASLRQPLATGVSLVLGADLEGARIEAQRLGSPAVPPREGDPATFGQPPGDAVAFDQWTTHQIGAAAFAELELSSGRIFSVRPGVRLEPTVLEGERLLPRAGGGVDVGFSRFALDVEPRLSAQLRPIPELNVSAALGLYHQPPDALDLSASFGNTSLTSSTGFHSLLNVAVHPARALTIEVLGYFKLSGGLAARSSLATPPVAQALTGTGEARSYGGMVVLKPLAWRWLSGWASYSLSRSERRAGPDAEWRLFDHDQTHQFLLVASAELPLGFRVGTRVRVASGSPRTPVVGSVFDARTGAYQPLRGEQNSTRLPAFFQLDLRAEKVFQLDELKLGFSLDVVNVTNTRNVEELAYSFDYGDERPLTGLPLLVVLGARVEL